MINVTVQYLYDDLRSRMKELRKDRSSVTKSREILNQALATGKAFYGINTGFGALKNIRIDDDQLEQLQRNLLLSHAVGVGDSIQKDISRLMLLIKIHNLGLGYSAVSVETFNRLFEFIEKDLIPVIPCKGSLGASGDLAPLAHMALPLIGHGAFWNKQGTEAIPAAKVLKENGLAPIKLQPKDGLALINGTQLMTAYGSYVLHKALNLLKTADIIGAMSLEALQGSIKPFDPRIQEIRPHSGQIQVADNIRLLLSSSDILESHRSCGKVQDPYCLRCMPQVHGASRDAINYSVGVINIELNSVNDNPVVFDDGEILSGGNFHGQPLAFAMDFAAIALAELASIAERRTYLLLAGHDGLPTLLMRETGINSGFMIPQYTAAALVSENKILCHPASVDSIPSSLGVEDHVSMGGISALKLKQVFENVEMVLAIELFTAAQALDFRKPLRPGRGVEIAHEITRSIVPHREADQYFKDDLMRCQQIIASQRMIKDIQSEMDVLH